MNRQIPEADWKVFKPLRAAAMERFDEQTLREVTCLAADTTKAAGERCAEIGGLLRERTTEARAVFDFERRSTALVQLVGINVRQLLSLEEMARFSEATRNFIETALADRQRFLEERARHMAGRG